MRHETSNNTYRIAADFSLQPGCTDHHIRHGKSGQEPLAGANVFIMGTIDGCLTDSLGRFPFHIKTGEASIKITMIGFEEYMQTTDACKLHNLSIQMKEKLRQSKKL